MKKRRWFLCEFVDWFFGRNLGMPLWENNWKDRRSFFFFQILFQVFFFKLMAFFSSFLLLCAGQEEAVQDGDDSPGQAHLLRDPWCRRRRQPQELHEEQERTEHSPSDLPRWWLARCKNNFLCFLISFSGLTHFSFRHFFRTTMPLRTLLRATSSRLSSSSKQATEPSREERRKHQGPFVCLLPHPSHLVAHILSWFFFQ